jgi:hypothetical protein
MRQTATSSSSTVIHCAAAAQLRLDASLSTLHYWTLDMPRSLLGNGLGPPPTLVEAPSPRDAHKGLSRNCHSRLSVCRKHPDLADARADMRVAASGMRCTRPCPRGRGGHACRMSGAFQIKMRRVGERRAWPLLQPRAEYEIVIAVEGRQVYSGRTTTPSTVLVSKGNLHTTDSYDWVRAADAAFSPYSDSWVNRQY